MSCLPILPWRPLRFVPLESNTFVNRVRVAAILLLFSVVLAPAALSPGTGASDVNFFLESSDDLLEWDRLEDGVVVEVIDGKEAETIIVKDAVPLDQARARFLRLVIHLVP